MLQGQKINSRPYAQTKSFVPKYIFYIIYVPIFLLFLRMVKQSVRYQVRFSLQVDGLLTDPPGVGYLNPGGMGTDPAAAGAVKPPPPPPGFLLSLSTSMRSASSPNATSGCRKRSQKFADLTAKTGPPATCSTMAADLGTAVS